MLLDEQSGQSLYLLGIGCLKYLAMPGVVDRE